MTCPTLALRRSALLIGDLPDPARAAGAALDEIRRGLTGDGTIAQLTRFGGVGLISSALYAATFLTFGSLGSLAANVLGMATSTLLANELHRRLTFNASAAVGWLRAQLQGGGLAVVGLVATSFALLGLQSAAPSAGWFVQILLIAGVTGAIGLVRFAALRAWVFTAARRAAASVGVLAPQR